MKKFLTLLLACLMVFGLAMPAMATSFTPSVEAKGTPEIVPVTGKDNNKYIAIINDKGDQEIMGVPEGDLLVTAYGEATGEVADALKEAKKQLAEAKSLSDLCPDVKGDNLVVRDLFDMTLTETYDAEEHKDGNTVTVRFDANLKSNEELFVMYLSDDGWKQARVTKNADGTVDVNFDGLCPVAFVVNAKAPYNPKTGDAMNIALFTTVALASLAGIAFLTMAAKKKI